MKSNIEINEEYALKLRENDFPSLYIHNSFVSHSKFRDKEIPLHLEPREFKTLLEQLLENCDRISNFSYEEAENKSIWAANKYIKSLKEKNEHVSEDRSRAIRAAAVRDKWGIYD